MNINAGDLGEAIADILEEYGEQVVDAVADAVDSVAKDAVRTLRTGGATPRRTGRYAKGWTQKKSSTGSALHFARIVYNKDRYRLTHLLEKGHRAGHNQHGFVAARPHIAAVEQQAEEDLMRKLKGEL